MSTIKIVSVLLCGKCGADRLTTALADTGDLVVACEHCNIIVLRVDKWPNPGLLKDQRCDTCGDCHHCEDEEAKNIKDLN